MSQDPPVPLAIVAAVGRNGAIGRDNGLPWSLPTDLAHFRAMTMKKPMIMGRRTWQAIGRPLPGRESIVISRSATLVLPPGVWRVTGVEDALALGQRRAKALGADEVALVGGEALFASLIAVADRLHMTFVDLAPAADRFFPAIDAAIWREQASHAPPPHREDDAACRFVDYVRR